MQLHLLDNLCHRSSSSILAIDERRSEVEYEIGEQWTRILTQKHLVMIDCINQLVLDQIIHTIDQRSPMQKYRNEGSTWCGQGW